MTALDNSLQNLVAMFNALENKMNIEVIMPALEKYHQEVHPDKELKDFVLNVCTPASHTPPDIITAGRYVDDIRKQVIINYELYQEVTDTGITLGYRVW